MNHRRRTQRIRAQVAAGTVSVFLLLFGGIYTQMSSGEDPVLASTSTSQSTTSSKQAPTVSAVTTRQS